LLEEPSAIKGFNLQGPRSGTPNGVDKVELKAQGLVGKAKVQLKGKGAESCRPFPCRS
jgi:hypothetical protein